MKKLISALLTLTISLCLVSATIAPAWAETDRDEIFSQALALLFPVEGNYDAPAALELLLPLAESGDAEAQYYCGWIYDFELEENMETELAAYNWYEKAMEGGILKAFVGAALNTFVESGDKSDELLNYAFSKGFLDLSEDKLGANGLYWIGFMHDLGFGGWILFIVLQLIQVIIAIIPGEPFEMVAGYAFGAIEGTILCFLASSLGSVMVLLFVRRFGMKFVSLFFKKEQIESVKFLRSSPKRILLFALIFILPGTPKDLLCYFAGVTDIKMWILILICSFGRIPAIVTSTIGGDALGSKSYILAIIVFAITVLISLSGVSIYKVISFRHNKNEK